MARYKEDILSSTEIKEPSLYRVFLHNDDYTSMDFVVEVLVDIFHKKREEAEKIMWEVHKKGQAICGVYTYEIAITKREQVIAVARQNDFPLLATIEAD